MIERSTMTRVETVYRRIHDRLWRSLLGSCGDPHSDAEAEAFAQAIRRGGDIDDIEAWIWTASFRILGGLLADRRTAHAAPAVLDDDLVRWDPSFAEFLSSLQHLSVQQREVIVLRYVAQFTPTEIARVIGSTPGSVRVQLHRAHESLRSTLFDEQEN